MLAAIYKTFGDPNKLSIEEVEKPKPALNQVCIKVIASSVNPIDWKLRQGKLKFLQYKKLPFITGADFCGVVACCGADVENFKPGDKVLGQTMALDGGACAGYCVVDENNIIHQPDNMPDEQAAGLSLAGQTSAQALIDEAQLKVNDNLLIIGAAGGVGQMAVQIAKAVGANVTAVCSEANVNLVESLGADAVIERNKKNFHQVKTKFNVVYDCVGNETAFSCRHLLKKRGSFLSVVPTMKMLLTFLPAKIMHLLGLGPRCQLVLLKMQNKRLQYLVQLMEKKQLQVTVDKVFSLNDIAKAHAYSETGKAKGKVIVRVVE